MIYDNELAKTFELITEHKFENFYRKYRPKLIWYLTRYTRDQEKAEDFADEAFIQALLKIGNYDKDKSKVHTWIYKIAENLVKKEFKDRKKMMMTSIDNNINDENPNRGEILLHDSIDDKTDIEIDNVVIKKAEIVKETIFNLPDKYKKVMIMRELENRPYLEIAELCTKEYPILLKGEKTEMPYPEEFLDIFLENKGKIDCYVNFHYNEKEILQMEIKPGKFFKFDKSYIENVSKVEIEANDYLEGIYRASTNLSTIKSQISKGRELIRNIIKKKFYEVDNHDILSA